MLHKTGWYEYHVSHNITQRAVTLPVQLRERDVQPIGQLDEDTTGLLLITNDGQLNRTFFCQAEGA